jgi:tRNA(fMet)-specific endonuclease VapC
MSTFTTVTTVGSTRGPETFGSFLDSAENWLREWTAAVSVLDIDDDTTHSYAAIGPELKKKGKPIPANDLWIATPCRQYSLPLLSRDRHFDFVSGLRRIDW